MSEPEVQMNFVALANYELELIRANMCAAFATGRGVSVRVVWRSAAMANFNMEVGPVRTWSGDVHGVENGVPHIQFVEAKRGHVAPFPNTDCDYGKIMMSFTSMCMDKAKRSREDEAPENLRNDAERLCSPQVVGQVHTIGNTEAAMFAGHLADAQLMNTEVCGPFRVPCTDTAMSLFYPAKWLTRAQSVGADAAFDAFDALLASRLSALSMAEAAVADIDSTKKLFRLWLSEAFLIPRDEISPNVWRMGFYLLQNCLRVMANAKKGRPGLQAFLTATKLAEKKCLDYDIIWEAVLKAHDEHEGTAKPQPIILQQLPQQKPILQQLQVQQQQPTSGFRGNKNRRK